MAFLLSECTSIQRETAPPPPQKCATVQRESPAPPSHPAPKPSDTAFEIRRYRSLAALDPDPKVRAGAHLQLAELYGSYTNPKPDYRQALAELEIYLSDSGAKESYGIKNWHALLRELVRAENETSKTREALSDCAKEKKALKDSLEELKNLDLKMEQEKGRIR